MSTKKVVEEEVEVESPESNEIENLMARVQELESWKEEITSILKAHYPHLPLGGSQDIVSEDEANDRVDSEM